MVFYGTLKGPETILQLPALFISVLLPFTTYFACNMQAKHLFIT